VSTIGCVAPVSTSVRTPRVNSRPGSSSPAPITCRRRTSERRARSASTPRSTWAGSIIRSESRIARPGRACSRAYVSSAAPSPRRPPGATAASSAAARARLALAYVALGANDAVRIAVLSGDGTTRVSPLLRQRGSLARAAALLAAVAAGGRLGLGAALETYALEHARPGLAILVSDLMMEPAQVERGVLALRAQRSEVLLLHVIGAGELDPGREF